MPCGAMLGDVDIGVSDRGNVYVGGTNAMRGDNPCNAEASTLWSLISAYVWALTRERDSKGSKHQTRHAD